MSAAAPVQPLWLAGQADILVNTAVFFGTELTALHSDLIVLRLVNALTTVWLLEALQAASPVSWPQNWTSLP